MNHLWPSGNQAKQWHCTQAIPYCPLAERQLGRHDCSLVLLNSHLEKANKNKTTEKPSKPLQTQPNMSVRMKLFLFLRVSLTIADVVELELLMLTTLTLLYLLTQSESDQCRTHSPHPSKSSASASEISRDKVCTSTHRRLQSTYSLISCSSGAMFVIF